VIHHSLVFQVVGVLDHRELAHDTARFARIPIGIVNAAFVGIFSVAQ
jgi:hypothetical protein